MKKIFLMAVVLNLFALSVDAQKLATDKIKWYTFEEAQTLTKKHPRKIFIDVFTDWCGWCKKLDAVAFAHPVIVKYMNEHYYPVKFNAEVNDTIDYNGKKYYLRSNPNAMRSTHDLAIYLLSGKLGYPSLVFVNNDLSTINLIQSYLQPQQLEAVLKYYATNAYKSKTIDEYFQNFKGEIQ